MSTTTSGILRGVEYHGPGHSQSAAAGHHHIYELYCDAAEGRPWDA